MYTISQLAKLFKISRSTLLYYDRIGLLKPTGRSPSNYRIYSQENKSRLELICLYRQCGLSLLEIGRIVNGGGHSSAAVLEQHLATLNGKIAQLRSQQHVILRILQNDLLHELTGAMSVEKWMAILHSAGLNEEGMHQWHIAFEKLSPVGHFDFLRSLGLSEEEIAQFRQWSRAGQ